MRTATDDASASILALAKLITDIAKPKPAIDVSLTPHREAIVNSTTTLGTEPGVTNHPPRRSSEAEPPLASSARQAIDGLFRDGSADRITKSLDGLTGAVTKATSNQASSPMAEMLRNHHGRESASAGQLRKMMAHDSNPEEYLLDKAQLRARVKLQDFAKSHHWTDDVFSPNRGPLTERGAAITRAEIQFGRTHNWGQPVVTPRSFNGVGKAIAEVLEEAVTKAIHDALAAMVNQGYRR